MPLLKCLLFNFWMIKLTKTPILPNCQVSNDFFWYNCKFNTQNVCLSFLWWQVFLMERPKIFSTYFRPLSFLSYILCIHVLHISYLKRTQRGVAGLPGLAGLFFQCQGQKHPIFSIQTWPWLIIWYSNINMI